MNRNWVLHPFVFAICPVMFLYFNNVRNSYVPFLNFFFIILVLLLISILLFTILKYIFKDRHKSGILVSGFFLLVFYSPFLIQSMLPETNAFVIFEILKLLIIPLFIIFMSMAYIFYKWKKDLCSCTIFINNVGLILLVVGLLSGFFGLITNRYWKEMPFSGAEAYRGEMAANSYPNIYYIILDSYGREDVLQGVYGYDNREFLSFLERKGFYVASKSRANYSLTLLSLASSLNCKYLEEISRKMGADSLNKWPLYDMIRNNFMRRYLKNYGYKFIAFESGDYSTEIKNADIFLEARNNFEIENMVLSKTIIGLIFQQCLLEIGYKIHRERILYVLDQITEVGQANYPAFVFVHLVTPHPPFVFSKVKLYSNYILADGSELHHNDEKLRKKYIQAYREQVAFINGEIKALLDKLLIRPLPPAVIILQSDHGPRLTMDWSAPLKANVKECISILNAIYMPGDKGRLYDSITPVNTFRFLRKEIFSENIELLPDKSFFSVGAPYKFIEVSK
jgi:hypothetical protein